MADKTIQIETDISRWQFDRDGNVNVCYKAKIPSVRYELSELPEDLQTHILAACTGLAKLEVSGIKENDLADEIFTASEERVAAKEAAELLEEEE